MRRLEFLVDSNHKARRLDVFLSESQDEFSRSRLKKLIEQSHVLVNNSPVQAKHKLKIGDKIIVNISVPSVSEVEAESVPLKIIYEDEAMLAVNKPAGMVVHPAPGHERGTLVNALLNHCSDLSGIGGVKRPGIVHRLDKDTSGVVLVAKNEIAHRVLANQFKNRKIRKTYLALVRGVVKPASGIIETSIGRHKTNRKKMAANSNQGRQAETRYEVLETLGHFSYLRLFPLLQKEPFPLHRNSPGADKQPPAYNRLLQNDGQVPMLFPNGFWLYPNPPFFPEIPPDNIIPYCRLQLHQGYWTILQIGNLTIVVVPLS